MFYQVGNCGGESAITLMDDLCQRIINKVQLTTDGLKAYLNAVEGAFGREIDYVILHKIYGEASASVKGRYSPVECVSTQQHRVEGDPDPRHVSTSYVERQNPSMRMGMRRFTRLTNAFSKKLANHHHALSLYFVHYNWMCIHMTLRVTPAMEAKLTDRLWSWDIIVLMDKARRENAMAIRQAMLEAAPQSNWALRRFKWI